MMYRYSMDTVDNNKHQKLDLVVNDITMLSPVERETEQNKLDRQMEITCLQGVSNS